MIPDGPGRFKGPTPVAQVRRSRGWGRHRTAPDQGPADPTRSGRRRRSSPHCQCRAQAPGSPGAPASQVVAARLPVAAGCAPRRLRARPSGPAPTLTLPRSRERATKPRLNLPREPGPGILPLQPAATAHRRSPPGSWPPDQRALDPAEAEVQAGRPRPRKRDGPGIASTRQPINRRTTRKWQAQDARPLVEGLPRGVVARPSDHADAAILLPADQVAVPARHHQPEQRWTEFGRFELGGENMSRQVTDADDRQLARPGNLRDDAAEGCVELILRPDDIRQKPRSTRHNGRGRFIAGGLDRQEAPVRGGYCGVLVSSPSKSSVCTMSLNRFLKLGAWIESDHMTIASSLLSV